MALLDFGGSTISVKASGPATTDQVLDVGLYFASLTLQLSLVGLTVSGGSPSFVLELETSMDPKAETWFSLGAFAAMSALPAQEKKNFTDLLRYVRWNVTTFTDVTSAHFMLSGVARNP